MDKAKRAFGKSSEQYGAISTISGRISDPDQLEQISLPQPGEVQGLQSVMHSRAQGGEFLAVEFWESPQACEQGHASPAYRQALTELNQALGGSPQTQTYEVVSSTSQ